MRVNRWNGIEFALVDLLIELDWVSCFELHPQLAKLVHDQTATPNIALVVVLFSLDYFWRNVVVGAAKRVGHFELSRLLLRQPEIANYAVHLDRVVIGEVNEHVSRLHVAVHNALLVHGFQSYKHLYQNVE